MHAMKHSRQKKDKDEINKNYKDAVQRISRAPGYCPVKRCFEFLFPSNVMMHILHKHSNDNNCTTSEIYEHCPLLLSFNPEDLKYGENRCVAVLMYGGVKQRPHTQPALKYMSLPNSDLLSNYQKYINYLPVMLLVCRTTWFAHLTSKQIEQKLLSDNSNNAGIYVFWLVSPVTTRKLYYTLTIFDRQYVSSRSAVRVVRNYTDYRTPSGFLPTDENYVLLRDLEVAELMRISRSFDSEQEATTIPMELILYQTPLRSTPPLKSPAELQAERRPKDESNHEPGKEPR